MSHHFANDKPVTKTDFQWAVEEPWSELFAPVATQLQQAEQFLTKLVDSRSPTAKRVVSYTIGAGGKRLRPALVLLCAKASGDNGEQAVGLAAVVELIHSGSLLHDDIFDSSKMRRGVESAWRKFGVPAAILVGDFMAAAVYQHLCEHDSSEVMGLLADAVSEMCESELLSLEQGREIDEASYLDVVRGKTGALFSASCQIGAIAAGASRAVQEAMAAYGRNLGMAFQITDDLLDLYGDPEKLGKSVGQDQATGMHTLAVIYAIHSEQGQEIARLATELAEGQGSAETAARLAERVVQVGGRRYAEETARTYGAAARQHLEVLDPSPAKNSLEAIAGRILARRV